MNDILRYEGYSYKIGIHGYVYVYVFSNEWVKTSTLTVKEFNKEMSKQGR